ncbi:MAG TPA: putative baseplate assembly protein [Kofleriaceae bacterium]
MPIPSPTLDNRKFSDLIAEALARIPIHNPEWTNFNKSDPGVTILEVAAFLLENDIYVANQIPERNRRKFLQLLGVPLQPASSATGLVAFTNQRGPLAALTLNAGLEVRAGDVPFRTERGVDVLPIEAVVYYKRAIQRPDLLDYYNFLYASFSEPPAVQPVALYQTTPLPPDGVAFSDTIDASLWIAVLARPSDKDRLDDVRRKLAGHVLSLGVVPALTDDGRSLAPRGAAGGDTGALRVFLPLLPPGGLLPDDPASRTPQYHALDTRASGDVLTDPGIVEVSLPTNPDELGLWRNLTPLESGVGEFPPSIDDTEQAERLVTWLRVRASGELLWLGANCTTVSQHEHVVAEPLADGTGEPDQVRKLARSPVLPQTVQVTVTPNLQHAVAESWDEIDDLLGAGPEVPVPSLRSAPGTTRQPNPQVKVFAVDAEAGEIRFGDGMRGARPPIGARLRADYDFSLGGRGNVGPGSIHTSSALPSGWTVINPVATWGGADAESVDEGEKQVPRYLQHRDRLVTAEDFEALTLRTPGVDIGRVEILPAFHPDLSPNLPGDAAGVVTVLVLPAQDPVQPDAPLPDQRLLGAVACWLEPRRLVTTELVLRGPTYVPIQISIAIEVVAGVAQAEVRDAVKAAILQFLSPLPPPGTSLLDDRVALLTSPQQAGTLRGWPLGKAVVALELQAVASRVPGVDLVQPVLLFQVTTPAGALGKTLTQVASIPLVGLQLPRVLAIEVGVGDEPPAFSDTGTAAPVTTFPVPVVPEECG